MNKSGNTRRFLKGRISQEIENFYKGVNMGENKYILDTEENRLFMRKMTEELLSFGKRFPSPKGSSYYLGDDGTPWVERPRETWITCRMAHCYSIGTMLGIPGCEALADAAINGLLDELQDTENGGWYPGLTAEDEILPDKQCYAHAFVILAGTSAYLAGRPRGMELLKLAMEIYDKQFWNDEEGLSVDTWNTEFTSLSDYRGLNANMHTVEAFLAVADTLQDETYRERSGRIIGRVIEWAKNNEWRIPEHFTEDWKADLECNKDNPADPFKPYGATPGHGIEWARLITQWALSTFADSPYPVDSLQATDRGNACEEKSLQYYVTAAEELYKRAVKDAWNADGAPGIAYTTDWEGNPVVHDRMHWTLAEAINSSAVLYHVTKNEKYADDYAMFLQYLEEFVHDKKNGSWFHQLDKDNKVIGTVWPGKSDVYHALQATLIPYSEPSISIAAGVKKRMNEAKEACGEERPAGYREAYKKTDTAIDVVALGELLIDFTKNGESGQGNPLFEANPGGAPCNVLSMLQKLGKKTAFIGKVGADQFGKQLRNTIEEVGICSKYLLEDREIPTTLAFIHTMPDGDRSFSFYRKPGADMMLRADEITEEMLFDAKIFHFGTLSMTHPDVREATIKAVEMAKKKGMLISLDPNLREPLWDSLDLAREMMWKAVSYCDILKISDNEIQFLTGKEDYDAGIAKLREKYPIPLILLTLGKDGSRAYYKDLRIEVKGFKQENVVDTTGAGDTFCGCVLGYMLQHILTKAGKTDGDASEKESREEILLTEAEITEMLTFANAAASLVTTKKGAIKSMPSIEKVCEMGNLRDWTKR